MAAGTLPKAERCGCIPNAEGVLVLPPPKAEGEVVGAPNADADGNVAPAVGGTPNAEAGVVENAEDVAAAAGGAPNADVGVVPNAEVAGAAGVVVPNTEG